MTAQPMSAPTPHGPLSPLDSLPTPPTPARSLRPVRVHPVPDREPEPLAHPLELPSRQDAQPHLELVPTGVRMSRRTARRLERQRDAFAPRPTSSADLPDASVWAGQLALGAMHVLSGVRSAGQLARFLSPGVYESLSRRRICPDRRGAHPVRPVRLRRVLLSEPRDGVAEASVIVDDGVRVRAVAVRMVGLDGRWLATELVIG